MGSGASSQLSSSLARSTHPRNRTFGAVSVIPGEKLPPPYTLNSEEEALAAGYSQEQIESYKASYEYFQRTNKPELSATRTSLVLSDPEPAFLIPGAAGRVWSRNNSGRQPDALVSESAPAHVQRERALNGPAIESQYVIVGAGISAGYLIKDLVQAGCSSICLIGEESILPYDRTRLTKDVLSAQTHWKANLEDDPTPLMINPPSFYVNDGTGCKFVQSTVEHIDVANRVVSTSMAQRFVATKALVIASGCRAATLQDANISIHSVRGGGRRTCETTRWTKCGGLHYLRNMDHVKAILHQVRGGGLLANLRVVVIGGGLTSIEATAALLAQRCNNLTIINSNECVASNIFTSKIAKYYESVLRTNGVRIMPNLSVVSVSSDAETGWVNGVNVSDGSFVPADLIVVAVGVKPNTEALQGQIELTSKGYVIVDECFRTSAAGVYAIGDVATTEIGASNAAHAKDSATVVAKTIVQALKPTSPEQTAVASPEITTGVPPDATKSNIIPRWSSYSTFLRFDWVAYGIFSGAKTVEFGIDSVLKQQLQHEQAFLQPNQQRRRHVQGHAHQLIEANSPVKEASKLARRFGVWFVGTDMKICGGFLEGGTDDEKADMRRAVEGHLDWPIPGWT